MKLIAGLALLCAGIPGFGSVVYSNADPASDQNVADVFSDLNLTEIGDQILLVPGPRSVFSVQALMESFTDPVTADITLKFYGLQGSGASATPGTLLGSSTLPAVSFPANTRMVLNFTDWNLLLPDEVVWTLSLSNATSQALGVDSFSPPTIGSSDPNFVWWNDGSGFLKASPSGGAGTDDYYLVVNAVPEPGTLGSAVLGLLILTGGLLRRRRF